MILLSQEINSSKWFSRKTWWEYNLSNNSSSHLLRASSLDLSVVCLREREKSRSNLHQQTASWTRLTQYNSCISSCSNKSNPNKWCSHTSKCKCRLSNQCKRRLSNQCKCSPSNKCNICSLNSKCNICSLNNRCKDSHNNRCHRCNSSLSNTTITCLSLRTWCNNLSVTCFSHLYMVSHTLNIHHNRWTKGWEKSTSRR